MKAGSVRFGEFKARKVPKSTYERPSKRKALQNMMNQSNCTGDANKSDFLSCSDEDEAVVSALSYSKIDNDASKLLDQSRVSANGRQVAPTKHHPSPFVSSFGQKAR